MINKSLLITKVGIIELAKHKLLILDFFEYSFKKLIDFILNIIYYFIKYYIFKLRVLLNIK